MAAALTAAMTAVKTATWATAFKRGRNPRFPYVPVIVTRWQHAPNIGPQFHAQERAEQLRGLAYATRQEAVAVAANEVAARDARRGEVA